MYSMEKSMSKRKNQTDTSCVSRISCFTASSSKLVRTIVVSGNELNEFGKYQIYKTDGGLCKFKVSAKKIFANVKKMKQTISPGGRITSFISGFFPNGEPNNLKRIRESYMNKGCANDVKSKSTRNSACPLASSLPRSCLSETPPKSRHKRNNGMKKAVRFCHMDVEVDEDCHKTNLRHPEPRQPELPHADHKRDDVIKSYKGLKNYEFVLDFLRTRMMMFEDDCSIDWSSDLVELERLSSFKN